MSTGAATVESLRKLFAYYQQLGGRACLFQAMSTIVDADLGRIVHIRNEGHTAQEALPRQQAHCAYHVGQLVLLARSFAGDRWSSLSIPRGGSAAFNAGRFSREKSQRHFTDKH